jgi:hypothetical protein
LNGLRKGKFDANDLMQLDHRCNVKHILFGHLQMKIGLTLPLLPELILNAKIVTALDYAVTGGNKKLRFQFSATMSAEIKKFVSDFSVENIPIVGDWFGQATDQGWSESQIQLTNSFISSKVQFMYENEDGANSFHLVGTFKIDNFCPNWLGKLQGVVGAVKDFSSSLSLPSGLDQKQVLQMLENLLRDVLKLCGKTSIEVSIATKKDSLDLRKTSLAIGSWKTSLQDLKEFLNVWDLEIGRMCLVDGQCKSDRCDQSTFDAITRVNNWNNPTLFTCQEKLEKGRYCRENGDCTSKQCKFNCPARVVEKCNPKQVETCGSVSSIVRKCNPVDVQHCVKVKFKCKNMWKCSGHFKFSLKYTVNKVNKCATGVVEKKNCVTNTIGNCVDTTVASCTWKTCD